MLSDNIKIQELDLEQKIAKGKEKVKNIKKKFRHKA